MHHLREDRLIYGTEFLSFTIVYTHIYKYSQSKANHLEIVLFIWQLDLILGHGLVMTG